MIFDGRSSWTRGWQDLGNPTEAPVEASADLAVQVHGVCKIHPGNVRALENVNVCIGRDECVSLVGPSGCGKSTLLSLIARFDAPSRGQIHWHPEVVAQPGALSLVPQDASLMPWATVLENISMPLTLMRRPRADVAARAQDLVRLMGLEGFEKARPAALSGGMRMRVSLARALVCEPQLLLLDEPFAALDEITRAFLLDELARRWQGRRRAALLVTHNIGEAVMLSDRVCVMGARPGTILEEIPVGAPHPRTGAFRAEPLYQELCARVWAALKRDAAVRLGAKGDEALGAR